MGSRHESRRTTLCLNNQVLIAPLLLGVNIKCFREKKESNFRSFIVSSKQTYSFAKHSSPNHTSPKYAECATPLQNLNQAFSASDFLKLIGTRIQVLNLVFSTTQVPEGTVLKYSSTVRTEIDLAMITHRYYFRCRYMYFELNLVDLAVPRQSEYPCQILNIYLIQVLGQLGTCTSKYPDELYGQQILSILLVGPLILSRHNTFRY